MLLVPCVRDGKLNCTAKPSRAGRATLNRYDLIVIIFIFIPKGTSMLTGQYSCTTILFTDTNI